MIHRIGLIANLDKPDVVEVLGEAHRMAQAEGIEVVVEPAIAAALGGDLRAVEPEQIADAVDVMLSFGGDGTFLRGARLVGESSTPLLGINMGSLGFLAEVRVEELADAIGALRRGEYLLEKRRRVGAEIHRDGEVVFAVDALNDVALNMGPSARAMDLEISVDGICIGRYLADGMIVASPTGSTAYNLSAGGPIVEASMDALVVNPICPHTLGVRPLILGPGRVVELRLHECEHGRITGDGQVSAELASGDRIVFPREQSPCYFLRLPRRNLFQIIQEKLRWGGLPRNHLEQGGKRASDRDQSASDREN
ncbi:NAD(+) kinase [bacterium]|nr:MAG: NAD(+) kinase [bacterium]RKZ16876.1 MAG: NAD(+) kinase [bacterium]